ncbi:MAG: 6-phospho-beta-glucosidase [Bacteroidales bacterium]|nr:6-phospho-beta-glucosidase [Bacteroidales bacterium]
MNYQSYSDLWGFIEEYLPNYYKRNDVLRSDILFRYINDEYVDDSDMQWIREEFGSDKEAIKKESLRLEKGFINEAMDCFYEQLLEIKRTDNLQIPNLP